MSSRSTLALIAIALVGAGVTFAAGVALGPSLGDPQPLAPQASDSSDVIERLRS